MKHSPAIELAAARRELDFAREVCPHWDYVEDGRGHDCCADVTTAKNRVQRATVAYCRANPL